MDGTTVTDAKVAFIRTQVRGLSAPLQPSTNWKDFAAEPEDGYLSNKVVQNVMVKVNDKIKQHNRMVYSAPSQRHVAEQIDTLYWSSVTKADAQTSVDVVSIKKSDDLTTSEAVASLTKDCDDLHVHANYEADTGDVARYGELYERLMVLTARRDKQQSRLKQYKQLQVLLRPFENAQEKIQPNLVTKDGDLAKELDRMRVLLARVTGRIADRRDQSSQVKAVTVGLSNEQKLANVMELT